MYELSLVELERELAAELPTRNLLRRRRGAHASARASFGSGANANATEQENINPQTVVNTGNVWGDIDLDSHNRNSNHTTQTATPINFGLGD